MIKVSALFFQNRSSIKHKYSPKLYNETLNTTPSEPAVQWRLWKWIPVLQANYKSEWHTMEVWIFKITNDTTLLVCLLFFLFVLMVTVVLLFLFVYFLKTVNFKKSVLETKKSPFQSQQDKSGWGKWKSSSSPSLITNEVPLCKPLNPNCSSRAAPVVGRSDCTFVVVLSNSLVWMWSKLLLQIESHSQRNSSGI